MVKRAARRAVARAAPTIKAEIVNLIRSEATGGQGADRYVRELKKPATVVVTVSTVSIVFRDPVLHAIEYGVDAFDIKSKMLAKAVKTSKSGGAYIDVPFTHAAGSVPRSIKTKLKTNSRLHMVTPGKTFTRTLHVGGGTRKQKVTHARGILDDIMKRGGTYTTIRRISVNSPASAWWHPGFKGRRLLEKLHTRIRLLTLNHLKSAFADEGFKVK